MIPNFSLNYNASSFYDSNRPDLRSKSFQNMIIVNGKIRMKPKHKCQRKKFCPEEDEKLKNLVEKMGTYKWDDIAKHMSGRSGRQCRDRFKNYLSPNYFNGQWTIEEDIILKKKYFELGPQWSKLTQYFSNRSCNAIKNRWNYYVSKHLDEIKNENIFKSQNEDVKKQKEDSSTFDDFLSIDDLLDYSIEFDDFE